MEKYQRCSGSDTAAASDRGQHLASREERQITAGDPQVRVQPLPLGDIEPVEGDLLSAELGPQHDQRIFLLPHRGTCRSNTAVRHPGDAAARFRSSRTSRDLPIPPTPTTLSTRG